MPSLLPHDLCHGRSSSRAPSSERIPVELFQVLKDDAVESAAFNMQYALNMQYTGSRHCSLPGSSVHGIFQAIVLEWIAISFSRESSQPRDQIWVFLHCRQTLYRLSHQRSQNILEWVAYSFSRDLPDTGIEPASSCIAGRFFTS